MNKLFSIHHIKIKNDIFIFVHTQCEISQDLHACVKQVIPHDEIAILHSIHRIKHKNIIFDFWTDSVHTQCEISRDLHACVQQVIPHD